MEEVKISIIVVNWNRKEYLKECVGSIKNETKEIAYEIIVVDNNSNDGSKIWLQKNHPEVLLIKNEKNYSFSKANNIGIKKSNGDYIILLNNDTFIEKNVFKDMYSYIEENRGTGIVAPKLLYRDRSSQVSVGKFPNVIRIFLDRILFLSYFLNKIFGFNYTVIYGLNRRKLQEEKHAVDWVSGACLMIKKELIKKVGLLDTNYSFGIEDVDLAYQVKRENKKVIYMPNAKVIHHKGVSRNTSTEESEYSKDEVEKRRRLITSRFEGKRYFFKKNKSKTQSNIVYLILTAGLVVRCLIYIVIGSTPMSNRRDLVMAKSIRRALKDILAA
jgi:GT2 family glycosyltransferase